MVHFHPLWHKKRSTDSSQKKKNSHLKPFKLSKKNLTKKKGPFFMVIFHTETNKKYMTKPALGGFLLLKIST